MTPVPLSPTPGTTHLIDPRFDTGKKHNCVLLECADPTDCCRQRRLADLHCAYCGAPNGYGSPLVVATSGRWSHTACHTRYGTAARSTPTIPIFTRMSARQLATTIKEATSR